MSDMKFPREMEGLLTPIDGGYHVRDSEDGLYCIDIMRMLYNWRIVRSPKNEGISEHRLVDGGWCFYGHGLDDQGKERTMATAQMRAAMVALVWDGQGDPPMFDRRAHSADGENGEERSGSLGVRGALRNMFRRKPRASLENGEMS